MTIQEIEEKFIEILKEQYYSDGDPQGLFDGELFPLLMEFKNSVWEKGYDTGLEEGKAIGYAKGYKDCNKDLGY